ncbi:MAG: HAMP domain-containing histidine kinase [Cyclobacteriaceae bacterium]|nr:HAMP domain-containing histidine kinase [Cyclobacteriaceae bacterium]
MRLLQVSLRSLLLYSLLLVLISMPISYISISAILNHEVDETLQLQSEQFLKHVKSFEYLDDLERDLEVLDQLTYNIHIKPSPGSIPGQTFETLNVFDSLEQIERPYRMLSSIVKIKGMPYRLTISMSLVDNHKLLTAIGLVQAVLILALTGGLLFINRSLTRRLWKPFYKTLDKLKAYEVDKNETIDTEQTRISEFNDLNKTIGTLTGRNRKIFLQQKEFIEDAAHELQTPLAVFQAKLDLLMQQSGLSEGAAELIGRLEQTAQRMNRLNKNLLLLSKIDNRQFSQTENIELDALVGEYLTKLKPRMEENGLQLIESIRPAAINANRTLIEVLATNLLHNAILHTASGGSIFVTVEPGRLEIGNTGTPLQSPERIFDRFRKETNHERGSGLGLAIVKKICENFGYRVSYAFADGKHLFTIRFNS